MVRKLLASLVFAVIGVALVAAPATADTLSRTWV